MKRVLILLFVLASLYSKGQAKLEMSPIHVFSPLNANTPASSVTYSTSVSITAFIKNTGTAAYTGSITLSAKRDTIGGVFCDSICLVTTTPLQPGDSLQGSLSFVPSPGPTAFKVAGNGNTIVVWPFASGVIIGDSLRDVVWITDANGIKEFESELFKLYPNPCINSINIKPIQQGNYKKIIIYDVFARKVKELDYIEIIDVSELKKGSYWIIINSDRNTFKMPFIKE